MERRTKIMMGAGIGLGLLGTGAAVIRNVSGNERRQKDMTQFEYEDASVREQYLASTPEQVKSLSPAEKEKISDTIKAMDESELRVVLQNIPVGLMFDEVLARMAMYDQFASGIQDAMKYLPR